jgi:RNA-directed DNA polymerase
MFSTNIKQDDGNITTLELFEARRVPIKRHIKIKVDATPYDPEYFDYLSKRTGRRYG